MAVGGSGKASQYLAVIQGADLVALVFHDRIAKSYLAITTQGDFSIFDNTQNCGGVKAEFGLRH